MGKINWSRVLLGGLVAGVVIDLANYVLNTYVWAEQNAALMKALGVQLRPNAIPIFLLEGLVLGIALVWAYAVARPRYGAGPKTAVITGLGIWVIGGVLPDIDLWASGILPTQTLCIGILAGLVLIVLASVVGAALYKEA
jgi:hypothetical protein